MTRIERRQRRKRQIIRRVCAGACALAFLASCCLVLTRGRAAREAQPEPTEATEPPAPVEQPTEQPPEVEAIDPLKADREALARMVWGEARGCSTTEQAAVVWCVLNRFDSDDPYYANCMSLYDIVTQPLQFVGYDPDNPLEPAIQAVVDDVLARWMAEKVCVLQAVPAGRHGGRGLAQGGDQHGRQALPAGVLHPQRAGQDAASPHSPGAVRQLPHPAVRQGRLPYQEHCPGVCPGQRVLRGR